MTEVKAEDGSTIVTDLPAEAIEDLGLTTPAKEPEAPKAPETVQPKTEEPAEPVKEPAKEPEQPSEPAKERPGKKASPFQTLLEKKHEAETQRDQALAEKAELEAKLQSFSRQPDNAATDDDIKAFAEEIGADPAVLERLVALARKGFEPQLPKEVSDLIAKQKEAEATAQEEQAFKADYSRLSATFTADKEILENSKVQERLKELAYSTEKAPDGEPYFQKPLFELYQKFVRPEFEPGKVTVDENRGGSRSGQEVLDFEAIHNDEAALEKFANEATPEQWAGYTKWRDAKQGDVPITRARS
jgi:hypothetical protein